MNLYFSGVAPGKRQNLLAAILSVIPGLGHLYKGHYLAAGGILVLCAAFAFWIGTFIRFIFALGGDLSGTGINVSWPGFFLNPITLELVLVPIFMVWTLVILDAFHEPNLRHH